MAKYDDASWHHGGSYPKGLAKSRASTHIGFFFAWAVERGMVGRLHLAESAEELALLRAGELTGAEFIRKVCDGKLGSDDLNADGNAFARARYAAYLKAYAGAVDPKGKLESIYQAPDDVRAFRSVAKLLDELHEAWSRERVTRRRRISTTRKKVPAR